MATKRGMRPEDVYELRSVTDPQLSPDGSRVAYVVSRADREADETRSRIWVAAVDGSSKPRAFTSGKKDTSPRWSPDGTSLAFLADRGEKTQLFVAPLDGGEPRALTSEPSGVSQPAWSPDGRSVAYVTRTAKGWKEPKDRSAIEKNRPRVVRDLYYRLDGQGFFDERRAHIHIVDVESGTSRRLTKGDWNDAGPSWSPDGRSIAFSSDRERGRDDRLWMSDVWVVTVSSGACRKVTRSRGAASNPQFSPDGKWIAYFGHEFGEEGSSRNTRLMVVPAAGGETESLTDSFDRPAVAGVPGGGRTLQWSPQSGALWFLAIDHGAIGLYAVARSSKRPKLVLGGDRSIDSFAVHGGRIVFSAAWTSSPSEVYVADADGTHKARNLSRANAGFLKTVELAKLRRTSHIAADGAKVETFVLAPPAKATGPRPAVLEIHGGPHGWHPGPAAMHYHQCLAAAGFVVLLPNPRGSTSYGEAFQQACVEDWGGGDFDDLMGAVDSLVEAGIADADRLCVGGYSYGGFMTSWTVGHTRRFKSAVVGAPVVDTVSMFGTSDIPLFSVQQHGGTPFDKPDHYVKRSPHTYMQDVRTPVLLLHWEGDLRCPIGQSEQMYAALKILGRKVEFVRYPGGSHVGRTPSQAVDRAERVIAWHAAHVRSKRSAKQVTAKRATTKAGTSKAGTSKAGTSKAGTSKAGTSKAGTSKRR